MRLQKMIAKFVIFMMLFVSVASSASTSQFGSAPYNDCSSIAVISHCCSPSSSMASTISDDGDTCHIVETTASENCCKDNQCHSGQIPIAILADELIVAPLEGSHHYKELEGSYRLINRVIFRPPVIA